MRDFFISYRSPDFEAAKWIKMQLEGFGYSVFVQKYDLEHTTDHQQIIRQIDQALRDSHVTVVCLSNNFVANLRRPGDFVYVKREFDRSQPGRLLMVLLEPLPFEASLAAGDPVRMYDCYMLERRRRLADAAYARRGPPGRLPFRNPRKFTSEDIRRMSRRPEDRD